MILVDTNVWSEAFRAEPDPMVAQWAIQNSSHTWLSSTVIGELLSGAHLLPEGKRKQSFLDGYEKLIQQNLDRVATYDLDAARHYGPILAFLEKAGRNPKTADAQIAAIAKARNMRLATRNVKDFEGIGLELVNPWDG